MIKLKGISATSKKFNKDKLSRRKKKNSSRKTR